MSMTKSGYQITGVLGPILANYFSWRQLAFSLLVSPSDFK